MPGHDTITLLIHLGAVITANPHIREIDINPVRVTASGLLALDAVFLAK